MDYSHLSLAIRVGIRCEKNVFVKYYMHVAFVRFIFGRLFDYSF